MNQHGDYLGENLIFLISQPRAGSTMLQRILGNHPDIHTVAEPWLMLHPLYALRSKGHQAEYDASLALDAMQNFIQTLPCGEDDYYEALRRMAIYLYDRTLEDMDKHYFLDKTPRYYFIIPELYQTFPQAHFIILLRNPLAVLNSILRTWTIYSLYRYKHDLLQAPRLLLDGVTLLEKQCLVVHYEQLVQNADFQTQKICEWLGIDYTPGITQYKQYKESRWKFGDKEGVDKYNQPMMQNKDKWVQSLDNAQTWRLAQEYLHYLGNHLVEEMGYNYEELQDILEIHQPKSIKRWFTFPLSYWQKDPGKGKKWRTYMGRLTRSTRKRGIAGTVVMTKQRLRK